MAWYFTPWTLQYIIGAIVSLALTVYLLHKNPRSKTHLFFSGYGICIILWLSLIFLHRNAATAHLSSLFFKNSLYLGTFAFPLLLLSILSIRKWKNQYLATLLLSIPSVISVYFLDPIISWSKWGWSYDASTINFTVFFGTIFLYLFLILGIIFYFLKEHLELKLLRRKYKLIGTGILIFTIGIFFTNLILIKNPEFPPFAGWLAMVKFIFIARAISL